nr:MAG TPA: hypothetical protein [Caudoviricetes sp.]
MHNLFRTSLPSGSVTYIANNYLGCFRPPTTPPLPHCFWRPSTQ